MRTPTKLALETGLLRESTSVPPPPRPTLATLDSMRPSKYPLEALAHLKKERADVATRQLANAVSAREDAERRCAEAEDARKQAGARAAGVREAERVSLEKGNLSAADLVRKNAWEARVEAEDRERTRIVDDARSLVATRRRIEVDGRAEVARAHGELLAVHRHEVRWIQAQERVRETKEEEAAAEALGTKSPR